MYTYLFSTQLIIKCLLWVVHYIVHSIQKKILALSLEIYSLVWQEKNTQIAFVFFLSLFNMEEKLAILELERPLEKIWSNSLILQVKENEINRSEKTRVSYCPSRHKNSDPCA